MNCTLYTLSGLNTQCRNNAIGGIIEVYVAKREDVEITVDENLHTLTPKSVGPIYTYKLHKNAGSLTSTFDPESNLYTNEISMNFYKMDTAKRLEIMALLNTNIVMMVKDANGKYWFLGYDDILTPSSGSATTGSSRTDASEYTFALNELVKELPYEVSEEDAKEFLRDYSKEYLCFKVLSGSLRIGWHTPRESGDYINARSIQYAYPDDEGNLDDWEYLINPDVYDDEDQFPVYIDASSELTNTVYFRGLNDTGTTTWDEADSGFIHGFIYDEQTSDAKVKITGNVLSLVYGDNFANITEMSWLGAAFVELFGWDSDRFKGDLGQEPTSLYDASHLILPVLSMEKGIYSSMFNCCYNLKYAPELPATTLTERCYEAMFWECYSLTKAPELPAMSLEKRCYRGMFYACESLVQAPQLLAPTLIERCYDYMFADCTNLAYVKCLAVNNINATNLDDWMANVKERGVFAKYIDVEFPSGRSGIPSGWIIQNV